MGLGRRRRARGDSGLAVARDPDRRPDGEQRRVRDHGSDGAGPARLHAAETGPSRVPGTANDRERRDSAV